MNSDTILVQGARVIDPAQSLDGDGDILVQDGVIREVHLYPNKVPPEKYHVIQGRGLIACPGFIDLHCHLREPGFEYKENIATGTQAAARGGFTTLCCMPNTEPPIDTTAVVEFIQRRAQEEGIVRVFPIGCVSKGRKGEQLSEMRELADAGVVAFSDDGSPVYDSNLMRLALSYSLGLGLPISDHCQELSISGDGVMNEGWVSSRLGLRGIPAAAEESMVARDIALAQLTGGKLHIAHASTAATVELLRRAKERGSDVTTEVCPHHLTLTEDWIIGARGVDSQRATTVSYDTSTKMYPPLRTQNDVETLIEGLQEGVIDCIATDHAPHDFASKIVTYQEAAPGISVLETALGSLLSLVHSNKLSLATVIERLTQGPARVLGGQFPDLATLKPGTPADIVLFDPNIEWVVDTEKFASKGKNSPLHGVTLKGRVVATIVAGTVVYQEKEQQVLRTSQ